MTTPRHEGGAGAPNAPDRTHRDGSSLSSIEDLREASRPRSKQPEPATGRAWLTGSGHSICFRRSQRYAEHVEQAGKLSAAPSTPALVHP